jgi:alpha-D-ribose 1-methylphosphonate 5-triphosphate synthase subunit PhnI
MGYVAVKGGTEAIERACRLFAHERMKGESNRLEVKQVQEQLYLAVDRVMGEGGLYAPDLAALAFKQAAGDTFEASFMLRAYRATRARLGYSLPVSTERMRVVRRISSAFKDIPGGQILGPWRLYPSFWTSTCWRTMRPGARRSGRGFFPIFPRIPRYRPPSPR